MTTAVAQPPSILVIRRKDAENALAAFEDASTKFFKLLRLLQRQGLAQDFTDLKLSFGARVLRPLYGIGMPPQLVRSYHGGSATYNLNSLVCPHTSITPMGFTLVDELVAAGATDAACWNAEQLVAIYDTEVRRIVLQSNVLSRMIGIATVVAPPSGADIAFLEDTLDVTVTAASCPGVIEKGFSGLFYQFVVQEMSLKFFRSYWSAMSQTLVDLKETLPAD